MSGYQQSLKLPRKAFNWFLEEYLAKYEEESDSEIPTSVERQLKWAALAKWNAMSLHQRMSWSQEHLANEKKMCNDTAGNNALDTSDSVDSSSTEHRASDGEPRNNLYWHPASRCPYLQVGYPRGTLGVLRLVPLKTFNTDDDSLSYGDVVEIHDLSFDELKSLDETCISQIENEETADFVEALIDFAEWDEHSRVSFRWPYFIRNLVEHPKLCADWRKSAQEHSLAIQFPTRTKIFLFFFCCEQIGAISLFDPQLKPMDLFEFPLSDPLADRYFEVMESVLFMTDNQHIDFRRNFSRCGYDYQAIIPDLQDISLEVPRSEELYESAKDDDIIYRNETLLDQQLVEYINAAKSLLGTRLYQPGVLCETVRNVNVLYNKLTETLQVPSTGEEWRALHHRKMLSVCVLHRTDQATSISPQQLPFDAPPSGGYQPDVGETKITIGTADSNGVLNIGGVSELASAASANNPPGFSVVNHRTADEMNNVHVPSSNSKIVLGVERDAKCRVSDGPLRCWTINQNYVHLMITNFETFALSHLHTFHYNVQEALENASLILDMLPPHMESDLKVRPAVFDSVVAVCEKSGGEDIWKMYTEVRSKLAQSSAVSEDLSIKKLINIYYSKFAHKDSNSNSNTGEDGIGIRHNHLGAEASNKKRSREIDSESNIVVLASRDKKRQKGSPGFNRWPMSLPIMKNNLYWIKNSEIPCICLGLEFPNTSSASSDAYKNSALIKVFPINCSAHLRQMSLNPAAIEPLDATRLTHCHDSRTVDFTLAMMRFAEWEMASNPEVGKIWYSFPTFIIDMISHPTTEWARWRKEVLRSAKGDSVSKAKLYFEGLVSDYVNIYQMIDSDRCTDGDVPWDDSLPASELMRRQSQFPTGIGDANSTVTSILTDQQTAQSHEMSADSDNPSDGASSNLAVRKKRESSTSKEAKTKEKEPIVPAVYRRPTNTSSLYWLQRHSLPCLRLSKDKDIDNLSNKTSQTDVISKDKDPEEFFRGQPVCCATYHYAVLVAGAVEPLSSENIKHCNDERTVDFTNALIEFQRWDIQRWLDGRKQSRGSVSSKSSPESIDYKSNRYSEQAEQLDLNSIQGVGEEEKGSLFESSGHYIWPEFILHLITHPKEWAGWRKKCERSGSVSRGRNSRQEQYLRALIEERSSLLEEEEAEQNSPVDESESSDYKEVDITDEKDDSDEGSSDISNVESSINSGSESEDAPRFGIDSAEFGHHTVLLTKSKSEHEVPGESVQSISS